MPLFFCSGELSVLQPFRCCGDHFSQTLGGLSVQVFIHSVVGYRQLSGELENLCRLYPIAEGKNEFPESWFWDSKSKVNANNKRLFIPTELWRGWFPCPPATVCVSPFFLGCSGCRGWGCSRALTEGVPCSGLAIGSHCLNRGNCHLPGAVCRSSTTRPSGDKGPGRAHSLLGECPLFC